LKGKRSKTTSSFLRGFSGLGFGEEEKIRPAHHVWKRLKGVKSDHVATVSNGKTTNVVLSPGGGEDNTKNRWKRTC